MSPPDSHAGQHEPTTIVRAMGTRFKVLHAPSNVANIAWAMAEGLRDRGHEVEVWNHGPSPNDFPIDRILEGDDPATYVDGFVEALQECFDVFHFHGTRSLIPSRKALPTMWDLPVLRALGKRIVFTFHGSDIRIPSHHIANDEWSFYRFADIPSNEHRIKRRLSIVRTYADHMTVGSVLDLPYAPDAVYIPKPLDLHRYRVSGLHRKHHPVLLHATRRRATKGTEMIVDVLEDLRSRGYKFEARILDDVPYSQLLAEMEDCDIVVEKVLGGDAGVLSLEALAMGKVAVARIRDEVKAAHPGIPVVNADPTTLRETLAPLISDFNTRLEASLPGRPYIEEVHAPEVIAGQLEQLYAKPGRHSSRRYPEWNDEPTAARLEAADRKVERLEIEVARLRQSLRSR